MKVIYEKQCVDESTYLREIIVESDYDLLNIPSNTACGSIAHTCGYARIWEKAIDGTWTSIPDWNKYSYINIFEGGVYGGV